MTLPLKLGKQSVNCQGTAFIAIIGTKSVELKLRKYQRGSGSICPSSFLKKHSKKIYTEDSLTPVRSTVE